MRDPAPPEDDEPTPRPGRLTPTSVLALVGWAVVGGILGAAVRPVAERLDRVAPTVGWLPALLLVFLAAGLAGTARATRRAMRGLTERPPALQLVNRYVMGRASAVAGALVAGGYGGYAWSWLGNEAALAGQRARHSLAAAAAAVVVTVAALLLERACRIRSEDEDA